jgi:Fic family protein
MQFDPKKPYNKLPILPPPEAIETPEILKMAIKAHIELAELKGAGPLLPNQRVLLQVLNLQEAKLSSEIENIVTTNDDLYKSLNNESSKNLNPHTKEVLRYQNALWYGYEQIKKGNRLLTTPLFEEMVEIITENRVGVRNLPGTKLENPRNKEVIYTPPEGNSLLREKLSNLEHFIYSHESWDSLVKLAVMHYQFEAIHPFFDGNGRTGRIINILYLIEKGLLNLPIIYLSRYIIENKALYYSLLLDVSKNQNWQPWIKYILKGITETAKATREKIFSIRDLIEETRVLIQKKCPKIYSKDLVEVLFLSPYCKIRFLEDHNIAKRQAAAQYLKEIEKVGILKSEKIGRELYFINQAFLDLLIS